MSAMPYVAEAIRDGINRLDGATTMRTPDGDIVVLCLDENEVYIVKLLPAWFEVAGAGVDNG
jgi:hypothetical protein